MTSFYILLFILISVNAVMMLFSLLNEKRKSKTSATQISEMHTLDLSTSELKKAV